MMRSNTTLPSVDSKRTKVAQVRRAKSPGPPDAGIPGQVPQARFDRGEITFRDALTGLGEIPAVLQVEIGAE
jgi:hypothetical protein